jgi:hypothetical protein
MEHRCGRFLVYLRSYLLTSLKKVTVRGRVTLGRTGRLVTLSGVDRQLLSSGQDLRDGNLIHCLVFADMLQGLELHINCECLTTYLTSIANACVSRTSAYHTTP